MDESKNHAGVGDLASEIDQLHLANRDLQEQLAATRRELEGARASERLIRESRWWRLGLALKNRRNVLFALRHPIWALKTLAGLRTRRGRLGRGVGRASAVTARQWLAGIRAEPRVPEDLWIAGIVDDDLARALEPDTNLITFRPDNWQATVEGRHPHMLLVESAERGNDGSWEYRVASTPHADGAGLQDLRQLIDWCRANGTPTVFWYTGSHESVGRFSEAAALFDHVVATEQDAAMRLQRSGDLRAAAVLVVPPGIQPAVHSPIGAALANDTCTIMPAAPSDVFEQLLGAAQTFGLTIYSPEGADVALQGVSFVRPDALERALANHAVYVNGDASGLPARALRAAASGSVIVSVPNAALEGALGDAVSFARTTEEAKEVIQRLLSDDALRAATRKAGMRAVLGTQTVRHRIAAIGRIAGFGVREDIDARISALVLSPAGADPGEIALRLSDTGTFAEIVLGAVATVLPRDVSDEERPVPVNVVQQDPALSESVRLQALAAIASNPWVAPVSPDGNAGVEDLILAQRYARADVLAAGEAFVFADAVDPAVAVARRQIVAARGWPPSPQWAREGVRMFTVPR
jgi:hypothetical protein